MNPSEAFELLDWKRRIFDLYATVRAEESSERAWRFWREVRDEMFRTHPQSPIPSESREAFQGLPFFDYNPDYAVRAKLETAPEENYEIGTSGDSTMSFTRFATASIDVEGEALTLEVYWLDAYGGGVFLPFRDATSGKETYGAGRYLLDTVKGADLGSVGDEIVVDFNFAYNPSCAYDPRWVCPLAPPPNRLQVPIPAGERLET